MAANIADTYGTPALRWLVEDLAARVSHRAIALRFGVSHARVGQWSRALGYTRRVYLVHADVKKISLERPGPVEVVRSA